MSNFGCWLLCNNFQIKPYFLIICPCRQAFKSREMKVFPSRRGRVFTHLLIDKAYFAGSRESPRVEQGSVGLSVQLYFHPHHLISTPLPSSSLAKENTIRLKVLYLLLLKIHSLVFVVKTCAFFYSIVKETLF